jgi:3-phenylpropionate/trans-cinnamate dioxygenase ferredoxin component
MRIGGSQNAMEGWIDVGPADLMEGELRGLEVGERLVLLARHLGRITAMDDSCNHAGCLLSGGWMQEKKGAVVCPCHEYAFELASGRNVTFPRLCDDQPVFEVRVERGRVMIRIESGT